MFDLGIMNTVFWCVAVACIPVLIIMAIKAKNLLLSILTATSILVFTVNLSLAVDHRWIAFLDNYVPDWTRIHDYVFYGTVLLDFATAIALFFVRKNPFNKKLFLAFIVANLVTVIISNVYNCYTAGVNYHAFDALSADTVKTLELIALIGLYARLLITLGGGIAVTFIKNQIVEQQVEETEEIVEQEIQEEQPEEENEERAEEVVEETVEEIQEEQQVEETIEKVVEEITEEVIQEEIIEEITKQPEEQFEQETQEEQPEETTEQTEEKIQEEVVEEIVEEQVEQETQDVIEETVNEIQEEQQVEEIVEEQQIEETIEQVVEEIIEEVIQEEVIEKVVEQQAEEKTAEDQPTTATQSPQVNTSTENDLEEFVSKILAEPLVLDDDKQDDKTIATERPKQQPEHKPAKKLSRSKRKVRQIKRFVSFINESTAESQIPNMYCKNCGTRTHSQSKICPRCFHRMSPLYKCPRCSTLNETRTCTNCGTKMPRRR